MKFTLFCFIAFILSGSALGQVVINEFSAANYSHYAFDGGGWNPDYEDYIELYNSGNDEVDLAGYYLSDDINDPLKWMFPPGVFIEPGDLLLVAASGKGDFIPDEYGVLNTNFKLRQTGGEDVVFSDPDGNLLEHYSFAEFGPNVMDHSHSRITNGEGNWFICASPTPGTTNGGIFASSYTAMPIIDPDAGFYDGPITVSISTTEPDSEIYYTLDGTEPTCTSSLYSELLVLSASTVVKAIVCSNDGNILPGFAETNTYLIDTEDHSIPVVCISGEDLSDGDWQGQAHELTTLEMFDTNGTQVAEAHGDSDEHGNDSNAYDQRGFDFVTRDQLGQDHHVQHTIFPTTERDEFKRLIFKAAGNDNASFQQGAHMRDLLCQTLSQRADLDLDERSGVYAAVYINAQYWGLYDIREKVDDEAYTEWYYNQPEGSIDYIKTWGGTWEEYGPGCLDDWSDLSGYYLDGELCEGVNYEYLSEQIEISSLIDFFILQTYVVNQAWLNWDHSWWRGTDPDGDALKWRYALWDLDATFDHYVNYLGIPDASATASPCDVLDLGDPGGQGHVPLLSALLEVHEFETQYVERYLELCDTYFSCEFMNYMVDSLESSFEGEMQRQVDRWPQEGVTVETWQEEIQELRDFINVRCDTIVGLIAECWDLAPDSTSGFDLVVGIDGDGFVEVNGVQISEMEAPYSILNYSCDELISLDAIDNVDQFTHWELIEGDIPIGDGTSPSILINLDEDVEIIAHFDFVDDINESFQQVELFPNPATDQLSVNVKKTVREIFITDLTGRIVQRAKANGLAFQIDVSTLASGVYALVVESGDHRFCEQFVKH